MEPIKQELTKKSRAAKQDQRGQLIAGLSIVLIMLVVLSILYMITSRGLATFTQDHISVVDFFTKTVWNPGSLGKNGQPLVGALPMIIGSFMVTVLAALLATPFAVATAVFMSEIANKRGQKILQPVIELLVGIPSVVYGFIGLVVVVPITRHFFGGTGFGILSGTFVLFVMILPTITSMYIDSLKAVPRFYREASLALGATRWQTLYKVIVRSSISGLLTAIIFGMARAFGEALAVQMVIGNAALMPDGLLTPAATLTSVLTTGIGNTVMGTLPNNALWTLALILLFMSLFFNLITRYIGRKGELK
ncbi:phosphate ABC transporter permease subunit PstC [Pediococcus claussenii]|uniref:Phosphate transport system permease protein n=1 Tax=Pediococcus claussenii (strain ATCC BAA-344 / DSM 14800 / JCM 18046 / KCTC 3811 / LMG 21948 / P06) TaxID=701521 RepID=G8PC07_PEDCP|nr:phosphate ABC transporter permease subunit PstC [Pediococcus claussenii]AEV94826.1 phosphate ABC transporter, permease protein PstC [Pediococcus claussenii ATCC BAA-344]ANZ70023.1 phosphate ABC transporter permease subunit PstC [Pediococcus claussenii]ANZ71838.1 phosphate ABC transporter permease subunit PstC [Pediococcus claussenii]KRN21005.1 pstC protein [Pediococcus claussenii]